MLESRHCGPCCRSGENGRRKGLKILSRGIAVGLDRCGNPLCLLDVQPLASLFLFVGLCLLSPRIMYPANTVLTPGGKNFLAVFPENDPPALFGRAPRQVESSSCTATYTARIHLWRYVVERNEAGGFRYEKILSVRIPRPAHLPRFRHSQGGTG